MSSLLDSVRVQMFRKRNRPAAGAVRRKEPLKHGNSGNIRIGKDIEDVEDREMEDSGVLGEDIPESIWEQALEEMTGSTASEENIQKGQDDDSLLAQIDEFRVKAQHLQQLLLNKEAKAQELQQIVDEREGKAEELQQLLEERQERADGFTIAVEKKMDSLMNDVNVRLDEVGMSISRKLAENQNVDQERMARLQESVEQVSRKVDGVGQIAQKVDSLGAISEKVDGISGISEKIDSLSRMTEQVAGLSQIPDQLNTVKTDLSDKIHTESVQSYRKLADIFMNVDERFNKVNEMERQVKKLKGLTGVVIAFTLINLAGVIAAILVSLGIF